MKLKNKKNSKNKNIRNLHNGVGELKIINENHNEFC